MAVLFCISVCSVTLLLKNECSPFVQWDNALISGHSGGLTPGNPWAFEPRHLPIPPTQGQYSSTKSYHCPSPREHNLKGLPNCNEISCTIFNKSLTKTCTLKIIYPGH